MGDIETQQPGPVIVSLRYTLENTSSGFQKTAASEMQHMHITQRYKDKEKEEIVDEIHFHKSELLPTMKIEEIGLMTKQ